MITFQYFTNHHIKQTSKPTQLFRLLLIFILLLSPLSAQNAFTAEDLLNLEYISGPVISPDGQWIAYTKVIPRKACDDPGKAYRELHLLSVKTGENHPYITGKVSIYDIAWKPDGSEISFTTSRGEKSKSQVWSIPTNGGEARQITDSPTSVESFK